MKRNRGKIRDLVNSKLSQKKRKEILVQEGGAFLAPLLAPVLEYLVVQEVEGDYKRINERNTLWLHRGGV